MQGDDLELGANLVTIATHFRLETRDFTTNDDNSSERMNATGPMWAVDYLASVASRLPGAAVGEPAG